MGNLDALILKDLKSNKGDLVLTRYEKEYSNTIELRKKELNAKNATIITLKNELNVIKSQHENYKISNLLLLSLILVMVSLLFSLLKLKRATFNINNINKKKVNLFLIVWMIFHLLKALTSKDFFNYHLSWGDFWVFDYWRPYSSFVPKNRYDISEFSFYVLLPLIFVFGRRYLRNEKLF